MEIEEQWREQTKKYMIEKSIIALNVKYVDLSINRQRLPECIKKLNYM